MNTSNARSHRCLAALPLAALFSLLTLFAVAPPARGAANANPPGKMTFQGFLTDASNPPVPLGNTTPANTTVIFKIYKSPTGTAATDVLWAESQVVTVDKGHFSVLLGEGSAVGSFPHPTDLSGVFIGADASDRWIGLTVDNAEITPRIQFFAAPYAQLAKAATSLVNPSGGTILNLANGKLEGIADLSVTGSVTSFGSVAGLIFNNRDTPTTGAGSTWQWYSAGGTARLWSLGDRMSVTSAGNVGIGTSSPGAKLDVQGGPLRLGSDPAGTIEFKRTSDSWHPATIHQSYAGNWGANLEFRLHPNDGALGTAPITQLYIQHDGKVGLGTTTPRAKLEVDGNIILRGAAGGTWTDQRLLWGGDGTGYALNFASINNLGTINATVLTMLDNGNVGIGTASPSEKLHVNGNVTATGTVTATGNVISSGGLAGLIFNNREATPGVGNSGNLWQWYSTGGTAHLWSLGNMMSVTKEGNVGIGISSPLVPLHVKKADATPGTRKTGEDLTYGVYLGSDGAVFYNGGADGGIGNNETISYAAIGAIFEGDVVVNRHVWSGNGIKFSDGRAKNLLGASDSVRDLSLLRDLKIRDFTWIDRTVDNRRSHKKLIAQEVEQVFPQAVQRAPQPTAIPNVYQVAEKVEFNAERKELRLTLAKSHDFKVGDTVDLYADDAPLKNVKVTAVSGEREFAVSCDHAPKSVFVYGKYVTDFRAVDYDAIAMLNVSATQELDRQVQALKKSEARIAELEQRVARVAELEQKAARVDTLEREMAELKKLVAGLAQGQSETLPAARRIAARQ